MIHISHEKVEGWTAKSPRAPSFQTQKTKTQSALGGLVVQILPPLTDFLKQ
jgi:hypothetical protein